MASDKRYRMGNFRVTAQEAKELLDKYTIDQIQILIQEGVFSIRLYEEIRNYLVGRAMSE